MAMLQCVFLLPVPLVPQVLQIFNDRDSDENSVNSLQIEI